MKGDCLACDNQFPTDNLYEYIRCVQCQSFIYNSDKAAEFENKAYFDDVFTTLEKRRINTYKRLIFNRFNSIDQKRRSHQYSNFNQKKNIIDSRIRHDAKILEVGFGAGENLYNLLKSGIDAYGIDLSESAVRNFQEKYPLYKDRVFCGTRYDQKVDIVYCCALFEHLDEPGQFLDDVSASLKQNGALIIDGLPILNEGHSDLNVAEDISFWQPCHRAIYSLKGIKTLAAGHGLKAEIYASYDDYNYRVLSLHVKRGYRHIIDLRNPCLQDKDLPGILKFYMICREALFISSLAYFGVLLLEKG